MSIVRFSATSRLTPDSRLCAEGLRKAGSDLGLPDQVDLTEVLAKKVVEVVQTGAPGIIARHAVDALGTELLFKG